MTTKFLKLNFLCNSNPTYPNFTWYFLGIRIRSNKPSNNTEPKNDILVNGLPFKLNAEFSDKILSYKCKDRENARLWYIFPRSI